MFEVLVESGAHSGQGFSARLTSVLVHGGLVALAAAGVKSIPPSGPIKPVAVPIDIYVSPVQKASPVASGGGVVPRTVLGPPPVVAVDVPTSVSPTTVPVGSYVGPTPQEVAGRELRTGGRTSDPGSAAPVLLAGEVDEPVAVLVYGRLNYPSGLAAAGITGEVRVEFVVDTAGWCEPASVRVVTTTNPAFEAPARAAICDAKYRPGRVRGQAVRQLVQQKVVFRQR